MDGWPEITADTPVEEIRQIHKDIWQHVIECGKKPTTPYGSNCVLCEYAYLLYLDRFRRGVDLEVKKSKCDFCPALWVSDKPLARCFSPGSPYEPWHVGLTEDMNAMLAQKIRDIPFKEELE